MVDAWHVSAAWEAAIGMCLKYEQCCDEYGVAPACNDGYPGYISRCNVVVGNVHVGTCTQGAYSTKQLQRYSVTSLHSIVTRCSGDGVTLVGTAYISKCRCINQYWRETGQSSPEQQWLHPDLLMWSDHSSVHMSHTLACHHAQWWCLSQMLPCVPTSLSHTRASAATVSQQSQSVSPPSGRHMTGGLQQRQAEQSS